MRSGDRASLHVLEKLGMDGLRGRSCSRNSSNRSCGSVWKWDWCGQASVTRSQLRGSQCGQGEPYSTRSSYPPDVQNAIEQSDRLLKAAAMRAGDWRIEHEVRSSKRACRASRISQREAAAGQGHKARLLWKEIEPFYKDAERGPYRSVESRAEQSRPQCTDSVEP